MANKVYTLTYAYPSSTAPNLGFQIVFSNSTYLNSSDINGGVLPFSTGGERTATGNFIAAALTAALSAVSSVVVVTIDASDVVIGFTITLDEDADLYPLVYVDFVFNISNVTAFTFPDPICPCDDVFTLKADFEVATNTDITTFDTTGVYGVTNLSGYGTPNPEVGDMTDAAVVFHLTDTTTYLPNDDNLATFDSSTTPPAFPTLPNTTNIGFTVTGEDLGYGVDAKIPDGVLQADYTVTGGGNVYAYSKFILIDATVRCCLSKLALTDGCNCGAGKTKFERGWAALDAAHASMECNDITSAAKNLSRAISICGGCGNC